MKGLIHTLTFLTLLILVAGSIGCGDDDDGPTLGQQQLGALVGRWTVALGSDVQLGTGDAPGNWSNFSITFNDTFEVSVDGVPSEAVVFDISTYSISGDNATLLTLTFNGEPSETAVAEINDDTMTLSFTINDDNDQLGARNKSVDGDWTFFLQR